MSQALSVGMTEDVAGFFGRDDRSRRDDRDRYGEIRALSLSWLGTVLRKASGAHHVHSLLAVGRLAGAVRPGRRRADGGDVGRPAGRWRPLAGAPADAAPGRRE